MLDEIEEIDTKNCTCYYFNETMADRDIYSSDILSDKNSYETYENFYFLTFHRKL